MNDQINITCNLNSINGGDIDIEEQSNKTPIANTGHQPEKFSLSNDEDDDDDSGFCCPCCLPR
jgi:hypothetical protein